MPYELFNKKGQRPRIGIGELITAEEIKHFKDTKVLGDFLRNKIYNMPLPTSFTPKTKLNIQDKTV
jgi:hypothetical protein